MIIQPTVGRVVWFTTGVDHGFSKHDSQPFAAIVTYVWNDRMVNLAAFDHNSVPLAFTSVTLVQENDPKPEGYYAEWMPYQVGQAKKHADDKPA